MSSNIDPDAHAEACGTTTDQDIGPLSRREIRRYARAVEDDNPLFQDVEYAREQGYDDLVVPPNFLPAIIEPWEGPPATSLREDGVDPDLLPVPLPDDAVLMGGGQELSIERYATAGERVSVSSTFQDIFQKETEGGLLTFLIIDSTFRAEGETILTCTDTVIIGDK